MNAACSPSEVPLIHNRNPEFTAAFSSNASRPASASFLGNPLVGGGSQPSFAKQSIRYQKSATTDQSDTVTVAGQSDAYVDRSAGDAPTVGNLGSGFPAVDEALAGIDEESWTSSALKRVVETQGFNAYNAAVQGLMDKSTNAQAAPATVLKATRALGSIADRGDTKVLEYLLKLSGKDYPHVVVRQEAIKATACVAQKGSKGAINKLLMKLDDPIVGIRWQVTRTLAQLAQKDDPTVIGWLCKRALQDADWGVRLIAVNSICVLLTRNAPDKNSKHSAALTQLCQDPRPEVSEAALKALDKIKPAEC